VGRPSWGARRWAPVVRAAIVRGVTPPSPDAPTPEGLLALATEVADEAAALVVSLRARGGLAVATKSSPTDMVTEVDRAAEALIRERLLAARPHDTVLGEEYGLGEEAGLGGDPTTTGAPDPADAGGASGVRWVVDPIDGTTNFLYGHPGFAVSIAAELGGRTVAGVVRVPLPDETFTATLGGGARRDGEPIASSSVDVPSQALVATGFSYDPARRRRQAAVLTSVLGDLRDVRRMGAASVDLCSVACGRVDGYWERGLQPWDHAAGALIASEAGARVADLGGGPVGAGCLLAANPALWESLAILLDAAGAADA